MMLKPITRLSIVLLCVCCLSGCSGCNKDDKNNDKTNTDKVVVVDNKTNNIPTNDDDPNKDSTTPDISGNGSEVEGDEDINGTGEADFGSAEDYLTTLASDMLLIQRGYAEITKDCKVYYDDVKDRIYINMIMSDKQINTVFGNQKKYQKIWKQLTDGLTEVGDGVMSVEGIGRDVVVQVTNKAEDSSFFIYQSGFVAYNEME